MNSEMEYKYQRLRSLFFGLCIVAAGMLFLSSASNIVKSLNAAQWPVHKGVVTSQSKGSTYFGGPWLEYTYTVNGQQYRGTRIGFGISRPERRLDNGEPVVVYVNPQEVTTAVIAVGLARSHIIGLIFSAAFVGLGVILWRRTQ